MSITFTGKMPNISDKTGEPEYLDGKDGQNKTRLMLDHFRKAANVGTFDQAVAMCSKGIGKVKVLVMNSPKDESSIWVANEKTKTLFWMPKSHLDKK